MQPTEPQISPVRVESAPQPGRALDLSYEGLTLRVRSSTPAHLDWLLEFLAPCWTETSGRPPEADLLADECPDEFQRCLSAGAHSSGEQVDSFALDSQVIRLPRWRTDADGIAVHDPVYGAIYEVSRDRRRVRLLARARDTRIRVPLMRVVREFAMNRGIASGGVFLHAAAAAAGDRAIVVAGHSAAGKTTTLLHLLASRPDLRYVANDRILIDPAARPLRLRGMPSVVTLRPGTLDRFPDLRRDLLARGYSQRLRLSEISTPPVAAPRPFGDGRYGVNPPQFCALLQVEAQPEAAAALLVFPEITDRVDTFRLVRIDPAEAAARLPDALLCAGSWRKSSDLFLLPADAAVPTEECLLQRCRSLAQQIPVLRLELGPRAYDTPALAEDLIGRLTSI